MSQPPPPFRHRLKRFVMNTRREIYGLRRFIPGLREHHRLEKMVGPLGFWKELQRYHLEVLRKNGLQPHHTLLDLGCGPLQGGIPFIRFLEAGGYVGIDIDPTRIEVGHQLIRRHRLQEKGPQLFLSNNFGAQDLGDLRFDYIWCSQTLYYFDHRALGDLLHVARKHLNPKGRLLGDVFPLDYYEFKYPESARYYPYSAESLSELAGLHGLSCRYLGTIGDFGYPKRLSLRTNLLFEFTHANP